MPLSPSMDALLKRTKSAAMGATAASHGAEAAATKPLAIPAPDMKLPSTSDVLATLGATPAASTSRPSSRQWRDRRHEKLEAIRQLRSHRKALRAELGIHSSALSRRCKETGERLSKCWADFGVFWSRLVITARNEHTVINLIRPPDDEEALQPAQMVQIFWNTLAAELFVCCFQYQMPKPPQVPQRTSERGAGRRGRGGDTQQQAAQADFVANDTFTIAPITAITQGIIAAAIALGVISMCALVFRWGNSRRKKPSVWKLYARKLGRNCWHMGHDLMKRQRKMRGKASEADLAEEEELAKAKLAADEAQAAEQAEAEAEGLTIVEKSELTQIGWLVLYIGCVVCPGFNMLALCFCRRKKRVAVVAPLVALDAPPPEEPPKPVGKMPTERASFRSRTVLANGHVLFELSTRAGERLGLDLAAVDGIKGHGVEVSCKNALGVPVGARLLAVGAVDVSRKDPKRAATMLREAHGVITLTIEPPAPAPAGSDSRLLGGILSRPTTGDPESADAAAALARMGRRGEGAMPLSSYQALADALDEDDFDPVAAAAALARLDKLVATRPKAEVEASALTLDMSSPRASSRSPRAPMEARAQRGDDVDMPEYAPPPAPPPPAVVDPKARASVLAKLQKRVKGQSSRKTRAERKANECATKWLQATIRGRARRIEQRTRAVTRLQAIARGQLVAYHLAKKDPELAARVNLKRKESRARAVVVQRDLATLPVTPPHEAKYVAQGAEVGAWVAQTPAVELAPQPSTLSEVQVVEEEAPSPSPSPPAPRSPPISPRAPIEVKDVIGGGRMPSRPVLPVASPPPSPPALQPVDYDAVEGAPSPLPSPPKAYAAEEKAHGSPLPSPPAETPLVRRTSSTSVLIGRDSSPLPTSPKKERTKGGRLGFITSLVDSIADDLEEEAQEGEEGKDDQPEESAALKKWDVESTRASIASVRASLNKRDEGLTQAERDHRKLSEIRMASTTLRALLHKRREDLGWRSPLTFAVRQALAWAFNMLVLLLACFVSVIYALKFEEQETRNMCMAWLIAYGVTFAIVEPLQVLVIACLPCLSDEETKCGRVCGRARFIYNELCAP